MLDELTNMYDIFDRRYIYASFKLAIESQHHIVESLYSMREH